MFEIDGTAYPIYQETKDEVQHVAAEVRMAVAIKQLYGKMEEELLDDPTFIVGRPCRDVEAAQAVPVPQRQACARQSAPRHLHGRGDVLPRSPHLPSSNKGE